MQPGITYKWDGVKFRGDAVGGAYAVSREKDVPPWVKNSPLRSSRSGLFLNQSGPLASPTYYSMTEEILEKNVGSPGERARSVSPQRFLEGQGAFQPNREGEFYYSNQPGQQSQKHFYYQSMGGAPQQQSQYTSGSNDPNKRFIVIADGPGYPQQSPNSPVQSLSSTPAYGNQRQHGSGQGYQQQQNQQQSAVQYQNQFQSPQQSPNYQRGAQYQQQQPFNCQQNGLDQASLLGPGYQQPDYVRVHEPPKPPYNYKSHYDIGTLTEYAHPPPKFRPPSVEGTISPVSDQTGPGWSTSPPYEVDKYKEVVEIINQPYRTRPIITPGIKPKSDRVVGSFLTPGLAQAGVPSSHDQTPQGRFEQFQSQHPNEYSRMQQSYSGGAYNGAGGDTNQHHQPAMAPPLPTGHQQQQIYNNPGSSIQQPQSNPQYPYQHTQINYRNMQQNQPTQQQYQPQTQRWKR